MQALRYPTDINPSITCHSTKIHHLALASKSAHRISILRCRTYSLSSSSYAIAAVQIFQADRNVARKLSIPTQMVPVWERSDLSNRQGLI